MKTALYARVSTEKQEQQQTIKSQVAAIEEFARENGHVIVDRYTDDGWSGTVLARPELDRLRDDAPKKLFEAVLIHSPDRLARKYAYQELLLDEMKRAGVQVIFLNRPIGETPEDNMLQGIQGVVAEYEKTKIAERFRRGKLHKARQGSIVGHMAPYGYKYTKKQNDKPGRYIVNRKEATLVRFIFKEFTEKQLSLGRLIKLMHEKKIYPPRGAQFWQRSSLNRILRNETYIGTTYYNKGFSVEPARLASEKKYRRIQKSSRRYRPKQEWIGIPVPPILSRRLFEQAQEQLRRNVQFSPRRTKYQYLLRGLTRCGLCGSIYAGTPTHGKTHYRCTNRLKRFPLPRNCKARMISAHIIEPLVWATVYEAVNNPDLIITQFKKLPARMSERRLALQSDREENKKQLSQLAQEESRLLKAYSESVISLEQLRDQIERIKKEKVRLQKAGHRPTDWKVSDLDDATRWLRHFAQLIKTRMRRFSFEEKQQFLRGFLREIVIFNDKIEIKGIIPTHEPPEAADLSLGAVCDSERSTQGNNSVLLHPDYMYGRDAKRQLNFVIVKPLKHGKALPLKARRSTNGRMGNGNPGIIP